MEWLVLSSWPLLIITSLSSWRPMLVIMRWHGSRLCCLSTFLYSQLQLLVKKPKKKKANKKKKTQKIKMKVKNENNPNSYIQREREIEIETERERKKRRQRLKKKKCPWIKDPIFFFFQIVLIASKDLADGTPLSKIQARLQKVLPPTLIKLWKIYPVLIFLIQRYVPPILWVPTYQVKILIVIWKSRTPKVLWIHF